LALRRGDALVVETGADWIEVRTPDGVLPAAGTVRVDVTDDVGPCAALHRVRLTVRNGGSRPIRVNLKWTLPLAGAAEPPRWLIPGLLYKDNVQQYDGGLPSLAGEPNLAKSRGPWWIFRADLCAVPMVMAWLPQAAVAMLQCERQAGHMTGVGLDNRPGQRALVGTWPYREAPRCRDTRSFARDVLAPEIEYAELASGACVELDFWLYAAAPEPYAFAAVLRETFARWDGAHPLRPWFPAAEAAAHAAFGLYTWHYDDEHAALWEVCSYDACYGKNQRQVARFEMHTGFVSGIPYAHALRRHALRVGHAGMAEAGRRVIDSCCRNLTPFGTFWSKFSRDEGWTTGWPSPQRAGRQVQEGTASGELQARTLAEATIFAARAAAAETDSNASRDLWSNAVRSNLNFVLRTMRPDGNPGEAYDRTGAVLDWDGEAGLHWITALVEGDRLLGDPRYLDAAQRMGRFFLPAVEDAYLTGAPEGTHLLPTSEDPQNAVMAYVALWQATGESVWLNAARQAADYFMTFRWQYNTAFDPMTILGRYDYRTKGLDISSPNNVHLHPYGLIALPEMLALWEATGDAYLLKQTRNNLQGCLQMLAPCDGAFDARRGMMTERWYQTPCGTPKGGTLQLAHSWATGLVLYAAEELRAFGHVALDGETGAAVALEAVEIEKTADGAWSLRNPWGADLDLVVVVRRAGDGARGLLRETLRVPARGTAALCSKACGAKQNDNKQHRKEKP
jgi:hypothetical protein